MALSPLAGKIAPPALLIDPARLESEFYGREPDAADAAQLVSFGTSGHRGSPLKGSFNQAHIYAITQAICEYRAGQGITGPLYMGRDTHAVSGPAQRAALEVLAANGIETVIQPDDGVTPTPAVSRAILAHNRGRTERLADGIVVTPSHNPPEDGGFKYNPPDGGPADSDVTGWIQKRANALLREGMSGIRRVTAEAALRAATTHEEDFIGPYVDDLSNVIDMEAIRGARLALGVDPLGGAAVHYWEPINRKYGLDLDIVNPDIDPTFAFMTVDHDGKIRMDCSSPYAMAGLLRLKDRYRVAFANDTDADRHGIVTPSAGLLNPNHYLAVAIRYLLTHRPHWSPEAAVGKTLVSSGLIDRVVKQLERRLHEVPVGFKWFASGLLAAEITAVTGKDPGEHYRELTAQLGTPWYTRIDAPATAQEKARIASLTPQSVRAATLAGQPITGKLTRAPGNDAPIGGLKIVAADGWFAARPSGTESLYKIYAESFRSESHLAVLVEEAQRIVGDALKSV